MPDLTCQHCGAPVTRAKTGPPRRYCDKRCKYQAEQARAKGATDATTIQHRAAVEAYLAHVRDTAARARRRQEAR